MTQQIILFIRNSIFILLVTTFWVAAVAQKQANIWYFQKNAGLDFNSGVPISLSDGQTNTNEGSASICDDNGALLFYTDGVTVWDRSHQPMPNGTDLMGHLSSVQSATIVPHPAEPSIYYIFTVDEKASLSGSSTPNGKGLRYSVVDMSMNMGMGNVIQKNEPLLPASLEGVTAVHHKNGKDIWVIAHGWNSAIFYAFRIGDMGIDITPVQSEVGSTHSGERNNAIGTLKASPTGCKLAIALQNSNIFEIFDFNSTSGAVSNAISLSGFDPSGVEFSPDGNQLYFTQNNSELTISEIYQLNISNNDSNTIKNSATIIGTTPPWAGALQLAPDKKIYCSKVNSNILSVINNPNSNGIDCDFILDDVDLGGGTTIVGMPNFIQSYFSTELDRADFSYQGNCLEDSIYFMIDDTTYINQIMWDLGDNTTSSEITPVHKYLDAGTYTVSLLVINSCHTDTIVHDILIESCYDSLIGNLSSVLYLPSAITPNGDGLNDFFNVMGSFNGLQEFTLLIYDRWGNNIFESRNVDQGWDATYKGKKSDQGVFFYQLEATFAGYKSIVKHGSVSLIR